jgi:hypothetical protein
MWTLGGLLIAVVILIGCVALIAVGTEALKQRGVAIPDWLLKVLAIVAIVVVIVLAIRFLLTL